MRRALLAVAFIAGAAQAAAAQEEAEAGGGPTAGSPDPGRPADKGSFGVGIVLGEPTGISAKLYLDDDTALQGAFGFNFYGAGVQINAEYLLHPWIVQERDVFVLPIYLGPGVRVINYDGGRGADNHMAIGLRAVVGMLFDFKEVPLDTFIEVAGVIEYDFVEDLELALNLGAGIRYYF